MWWSVVSKVGFSYVGSTIEKKREPACVVSEVTVSVQSFDRPTYPRPELYPADWLDTSRRIQSRSYDSLEDIKVSLLCCCTACCVKASLLKLLPIVHTHLISGRALIQPRKSRLQQAEELDQR